MTDELFHHTSGRGMPAARTAVLRAAIRLLDDDSRSVARAAQRMLLANGERARPLLRQAGEVGDVATRLRARRLLRQLDVRGCLRRFAALDLGQTGRSSSEPLLAGVALAAQMVRTFGPEAADLRAFLSGEARVLQARFAGRSLPTQARLLGEHLAGQLEFAGADGDRLELDHVLLDRVLHNRVGNPTALSLVYLLVGRQAGLEATGVGMPGHLLVRLHGPRPVLVDPFHGGRTVTKVDCLRHLRSRGYGPVRDRLRDLTDREMLANYVRDLRRAAGYRGRRDALETLGDALFHLGAN